MTCLDPGDLWLVFRGLALVTHEVLSGCLAFNGRDTSPHPRGSKYI